MAAKKRVTKSSSSKDVKKQKVDNGTALLLNPRNYTFASPYRQQFSIPVPIIRYLFKNIKNLDVYLKLTQTCKYFFNKNPVIVAKKLEFKKASLWITHNSSKNIRIEKSNGLIVTEKNQRNYTIKVDKVSHKIWFIGDLHFEKFHNELSKLLNKIYFCQIYSFYLTSYTLSYSEYLILTVSKSLRKLIFNWVMIKYENNNQNVLFEDILKEIPNIQTFHFTFLLTDFLTIRHETTQNLLELPKFNNLETFSLLNTSHLFDTRIFGEFVKKHKEAKFSIIYRMDLPEIAIKKIERSVKSFNKSYNGCTLNIYYGENTFNL